MAKALVLLAEGVEEMEAVIVIDVLRRAGVEVLTAATHANREVLASLVSRLERRMERMELEQGGATVFNVYLLGTITPYLLGILPYLALKREPIAEPVPEPEQEPADRDAPADAAP